MKKTISFALALCTVILLFTTACKKDQSVLSSDIPADNATVSSESSQIDAMAVPVAGPAMHISGFSSFNAGDLGPCVVITFDTANSARTITIDYGTGCTCWDGRTRSGQVIISWTGPYVQTGSTFNINSNNYYVNNNKFAIHKTVVNSGLNTSSQPYFNVSESDTVTLDSTEQTITWNSIRVRTWTAGYNTPYVLSDDVYAITGSGSGTDRDGDAYTCTIVDPLIVQFGCPWIEQGSFQFNSAKFTSLTIDFGTGACDNTATVSLNGNTYTIHMR